MAYNPEPASPRELPALLWPSDFTAEQRNAVLVAQPFRRWVQRAQELFLLQRIEFQSVDFVPRQAGGVRALFIKMKATLTDVEGNPLHGVVVLRGDAVAVLPVLRCGGRAFALLVEQARPAGPLASCLEIPAGMLDEEADPRMVAVKEMAEETGMVVRSEELVDLLPASPEGMLNSVGLLDERIFLYAVEREVSPAELNHFEGRELGQHHENEHILTSILPMEEVPAKVQDSKSLMAWLLWRQRGLA
jgi:ADP-sugar diphosphatase